MHEAVKSALYPVSDYPDLVQEMNERLALGIDPYETQVFQQKCRHYHHNDEHIVVPFFPVGARILECAEYSLRKIGYKLEIMQGISLQPDLPKTEQIDVFPATLVVVDNQPLPVCNCSQDSWLPAHKVLSAITVNPYLATCFDSIFPILSLGRGWKCKNWQMPYMCTDVDARMVYIMIGLSLSSDKPVKTSLLSSPGFVN